MIRIISDPYEYHKQSADYNLSVTKVEEYVAVRQAIRRALNEQRRLTVYVTHRTVLAWLEDLRGYESDVIIWEDVDPTKTFTDFFGVTPSPLFDPKTILSLDLESIPQPQKGRHVDPVAWILSSQLGSVWGESSASPQHLLRLISTIMDEASPAEALIPLISYQLDAWTKDLSDYGSLHASTLYSDAQKYVVRWATSRYEPTLWNDPNLATVPMLINGPEQKICRIALSKYKSAIKTYWNHWFAQRQLNTDNVMTALEQMSGLSESELEVIFHITERLSDLDKNIVTALQNTFAHLPEAALVVDELSVRVRPAIPVTPDSTWTITRWLNWATYEYMTYFTWLSRMNQYDEQQQFLAKQWSDWLYIQYPTWLNKPDSPLLLSQYAAMRDVVDSDPDTLVLWLIIDGLTWWQGEFLREACITEGLNLRSQKVGIAILPSITSISKRALVTGVTAPDNQSRQSIASAADSQLTHSGISHYVTYEFKKAISHLNENSATRCYVVLSNRIDDIAHQMSTFTDDGSIRGSLIDIAKSAATMSKKASAQGRKLHIFVGSDHGSTRIPVTSTALPLPQTTHELTDWDDVPEPTATSRSTRAAIISNPEKLTSNEHQQWYVLDRHLFQLNEHYIVPRDYHYIGRRPIGWTHGGLTPEEVVVPLFHFTLQPLEYERISVHFYGEIEAYRPITLSVKVTNPNREPLHTIRLAIDNDLDFTIGEISALATQELAIQLPANTTDAKEQTINWSLKFEILGVKHEETGQQTLNVRRLQTHDTTFDDFFE